MSITKTIPATAGINWSGDDEPGSFVVTLTASVIERIKALSQLLGEGDEALVNLGGVELLDDVGNAVEIDEIEGDFDHASVTVHGNSKLEHLFVSVQDNEGGELLWGTLTLTPEELDDNLSSGTAVVYAEPQDFDVHVVRTGYGHRTFRVSAKSQAEADRIALDEAGSHDFSENSSEYSVEGSLIVKTEGDNRAAA